MAKKQDAKEPKVLAHDDESLKEAFARGNNALLPDNITIASPYGKRPDVGLSDSAEGPTGDDFNQGSDQA